VRFLFLAVKNWRHAVGFCLQRRSRLGTGAYSQRPSLAPWSHLPVLLLCP
jgi:hypothetical protein